MPSLIAKALVNPNARTTHPGPTVSELEFEEEVKQWILEQRGMDIAVRTNDIINHVIQVRPHFYQGVQTKLIKWVYRFLDRHGLSVRRVTRIGQKLSGHLKEVQDDATAAVRSRLAVDGSLHGLDLKYFINMDQTCCYFEMKSNTTVDTVGAKTVSVRDSGSNSKRATIVLAVAADGTKLPPFVIFKGKYCFVVLLISYNLSNLFVLPILLSVVNIGQPGARIEKEIQEKGWLATVQPKGWFDGRVGKIWIDRVLKPYVEDAENAFLLVDHFSVHLTSDFARSVNDLGVDIDYIPAGYTCVLQPVDVGVNATFKKSIRNCHHQWCLDEYPKVLHSDKVPTPDRVNVYDWVISSFEKVTETSIQKTFASIGYINYDGEEAIAADELHDDEPSSLEDELGLLNIVEFEEIGQDEDDE
jgi:hypothetical protein